MSAHETVLGHAVSRADLMVSMTSKPRVEFLFELENFSEMMPAALSSRSDPSHPYPTQYSQTIPLDVKHAMAKAACKTGCTEEI